MSEINIISGLEIRKNNKQVEWIAKNFIAKGKMTMFSAEGGVGKSMLSMYLSYYFATDKHEKVGQFKAINPMLFGRYRTEKTYTSLFLQTENDEDIVNERIERMEQIDKTPFENIFFTHVNNNIKTPTIYILNREKSTDDFENYLTGLLNKIKQKTNKTVDILWIDPLSSFCQCNENDINEMRNHLDGLSYVCNKLNLTPIIIHHNKKDGNGYRGASSIRDCVRSLYELKPIEIQGCVKDKNNNPIKSHAIQVIHEKSNLSAKNYNFNLVLDDKFHFKVIDGIETKDVDKCSDIVKALTESGGIAESQNELVSFYQKVINPETSDSTIKRHIRVAVKNNLIQEYIDDNKKKYCLVTEVNGSKS